MAEQEKAGRLPQQFGKFGEGLVLWWLGHFHDYNVALVDHEGADIVAHKGSEHLAISVKSIHAASTYFDKHNQDKLRNFADKFGSLEPAVAFVFAWGEKDEKTKTMIDVYLFKLDDFEFFCANGEKGFGKHKKDEQVYLINNGANFETLKSLAEKYKDNVKHLRLKEINGKFNEV